MKGLEMNLTLGLKLVFMDHFNVMCSSMVLNTWDIIQPQALELKQKQCEDTTSIAIRK